MRSPSCWPRAAAPPRRCSTSRGIWKSSCPGRRRRSGPGSLRHAKAQIIAWATAMLDPEEARAAEGKVLGRAGRLTPGGLRSAIARAVMEVAPQKARKRREDAEKDARVQRWAEDSGNAALAGRELPPAEVLAADQRISWWARQLKKAGLAGSMDELRARAYLDLLLDKDSRPSPLGKDSRPSPLGNGSRPAPADGTTDSSDTTDSSGRNGGSGGSGGSGGESGSGGQAGGPGTGGSGPPDPADPAAPMTPPGAGVRPSGFAGRLHLTVPLVTLLGLADRPGEIPGLGPVDPWLARDLARAAAANPKTTWCLTVTDQAGTRHRARLRPARAQEPANARGHPAPGAGRPRPAGSARRDQPGRARVRLRRHRRRPGRAAGRVRILAAHHRDTRAAGPGWSRWTRSRPGPVITGSRRPAMIRAASCGTWPRSGTPPAPPPPAGDPPPTPTSSTTSPTRRAAGPACVMAVRSAGMTTGSSRIRAGRSSRSPRPPSAGPPPPAGPAPPNPPGTPSNGRRGTKPGAERVEERLLGIGQNPVLDQAGPGSSFLSQSPERPG